MQLQNDTLSPTKICFGIFLTNKFPLLPLSIMTDTLRIANSLEERRNFSYVLISADGQATSSSCEFPAPIEAGINNCPVLDVVLVCTGQSGAKTTNRSVLNWLRKLSRSGVTIGGISSGAFILAEAGLLDGRECAVHWASFQSLSERFRKVDVTGNIFCIDGNMITCAGGVSTLDLMLHLIGKFRSVLFARQVADSLVYPSIRGSHAPARVNLRARTGVTNQLLLSSIELMESNLEDPVQIGDISVHLGTSTRHLERLFMRHFQMSPSQYYMRLRLHEAKGLLTQTDVSIIEVALRSGFKNASHFTRRYRKMYQMLPSEQRKL